jgi:predicted GNAT family N-acyltransferase
MEVRLIQNSELDKLYALRHAVLRVPLGLNLYDEDFTREANWIKIGAFSGDDLIGCVMLSALQNNVIQLRQMAVDKDFQRKGVGRKIVEFAEQWCKENAIVKIELHAREAAMQFYLQLNYVCIGDVYIEVDIPHYTMYKMLSFTNLL